MPTNLADITCTNCEQKAACAARCSKNMVWQTVMDTVYRNNIPKRLCGNYIALTAPHMVEEVDE